MRPFTPEWQISKGDGAWRVFAYVGIGVLVLAFVWWAIADHRAWKADCEKRGGHVSSHTDYHTSYDRDGNSHTDSNTTYYCLSEDGRILDIR